MLFNEGTWVTGVEGTWVTRSQESILDELVWRERADELPAVVNGQLRVVFFHADVFADKAAADEDAVVRAPGLSDETNEKVKAEKADENKIVVTDKLNSTHPLVERTQKSLRSAAKDKDGLVRPKVRGCLDLIIGPDSIERALRIMDALIKALEKRGLTLSTKDKGGDVERTRYQRAYESDRHLHSRRW